MGKEVSQGLLLVTAHDGQGEFNELLPGLSRGTVGRRDVVEILLTVHEGDMEFPELLGGDTSNLRKGDIIPIRWPDLAELTANAISWTKVEELCHG